MQKHIFILENVFYIITHAHKTVMTNDRDYIWQMVIVQGILIHFDMSICAHITYCTQNFEYRTTCSRVFFYFCIGFLYIDKVI